MTKICDVNVMNKRNSSLVVANSILKPKSVCSGYQRVPLFYEQNIRDVLNAERAGFIALQSPIPNEVLAKFPFFQKKLQEATDAKTTLTKDVDVTAGNAEETNVSPVDAPVTFVKNENAEDVDASAETVQEPTLPAEEGSSEPFIYLGADEINKMNGKELKAFIKDKNLDIKGYSSMSTDEVKAATLEHFGHEVVGEDATE